jgi:hypothetical protein
MEISPPDGSISFVKALKVVDLPAPLTPSNAKHSPYSRPKDVLSTAKAGFLNKLG